MLPDVPADEAPKACDPCAEWAAPHEPVKLAGDSFYVGPAGLASVVVRTGDGLVLIDGTLPESVATLDRNLTTLGLRLEDIDYVLVSHAHYDHVGGVAAIQRRSGAVVVTTVAGAAALRAGTTLPGDPQHGLGEEVMSFPPVVGELRTLTDGEALEVGDKRFVIVPTPGHTAGGASWTWTDCADGGCRALVFADSLNPVSADGFRFSDDPAWVSAFEASIARVRELDCDVLVSAHPSFSSLFERAADGDPSDPRSCRRYAKDGARRLASRLREER